MFAPFRLTRLLTVGLAACAVTWALAAGAVAMPMQSPKYAADTADRPAYQVVPGDVKEPESGSRPEYQPGINDDKSDADRARAIPSPEPSAPVSVPAPDDDTSTVALILSIAAILTALGAVTLTVTRPPRGAVRA
jgi:hypothetical protein